MRRYSDFVWLHQQLVRNYAGVVIPPLPEKLIVGRFSPEFVESRRRALEKFLNRVACHVDLRGSAHFKAFLESSEDGLAATKASTKEEQRARKKSKGWGQWFSEKAQAVSSKVGRSASLAKTPEDAAFDEVVQYVEALEPQVGNVHKHTQGLVRRSRDLANGLFEFGLAFTLLGQSEQGVLENALTEVGHTADKLSVLAAEQAEKEVRKKEYYIYCPLRMRMRTHLLKFLFSLVMITIIKWVIYDLVSPC